MTTKLKYLQIFASFNKIHDLLASFDDYTNIKISNLSSNFKKEAAKQGLPFF